jgi:hypothetical protein
LQATDIDAALSYVAELAHESHHVTLGPARLQQHASRALDIFLHGLGELLRPLYGTSDEQASARKFMENGLSEEDADEY